MPLSIVNVPIFPAGDGPIVSIANLIGEKTVELTGTFKGRYILLGTQNGSTFVPVAMFDSNGKESFKQTLPLALIAVRVRSHATLAIGVELNISGVSSAGSNKFTTVASVAPSISGVQPVVDLFSLFPPTGVEQDIGFLCSGSFKGVVLVEGSLDNIEFNAIGSFTLDSQSPSLLGVSPVFEFSPLATKTLVRYVRVVVNGVVTETVTVTLGGSVPASAPSGSTLAVSYGLGTISADQTLTLLDAKGGGVTIDASNVGFAGLVALKIVNPNLGLVVFPRVGGVAIASNLSIATAPGALWNEIDFSANSSITLTGAPGAVTALARMNLGQGTIDGAGNTIADAYNLLIGAAPMGTATLTRPWSLGVTGNAQFQSKVFIGAAALAPTALLHLAAGTIVAGTASAKINPGALLGATENGAVESDGTHLYWTDSGAVRRQLDNAASVAQTLATTYNAGAVAADQTLVLTNAKGGAFIINGTTPGPGFTGVTSFEVNVIGGGVNFYTKGGFDVSSSISVVAAAGSVWNEVNFLASTLTLTGGPATATAVSMVHIGTGTINGAGNTVTDAYNFFVDTPPSGTATLSNSWAMGVNGAMKLLSRILIQPAAVASGVFTGLTQVGAAHTGLTAGTEVPDTNFNLSATKTWATGAIVTQRDFVVQARTYAFVAASVVTTGATLAITGAPIAGANATITNKLALWVQSGFSKFETTTAAVIQLNSSAASTQVQFFSGGVSQGFMGYVGNGDTGLAIRMADFTIPLFVNQAGNISLGYTNTALNAGSRLAIDATFTINSGAGPKWNAVDCTTSTLTLTAVSPISTLNFFNIANQSIEAASALIVISDFYMCRIGTASFAGIGPASATRSWSLGIDGNTKFGGGQNIKGTNVNAAGPYVVLATDYVLEVRYTATAAISLNLPSIAIVGNGHIVIVKDSGYNATINNITLVRNGADKIENVAGNYVLIVSGAAIWLKANATTNNWEII
jgi:hypothetical protein